MTVTLVEVGPRDGLQNSAICLTLTQKKAFVETLFAAGFDHVECGAFVRADHVPQMADSADLARYTAGTYGSRNCWYLVPNKRGVANATAAGVQHLAFFTATSDVFNTKNIGLSVDASIQGIVRNVKDLKNKGYQFVGFDQALTTPQQLKCRLYISTVVGCPYEGAQPPSSLHRILDALDKEGVLDAMSQISLGDTIGVGSPRAWRALLKGLDLSRIAMHCHDTYGGALASVSEGLRLGVTCFDSAIAGLGGCPYARGATGNLATEDLLYFLIAEGVDCGLSLDTVLDVFDVLAPLGFENRSRAYRALRMAGSPNP